MAQNRTIRISSHVDSFASAVQETLGARIQVVPPRRGEPAVPQARAEWDDVFVHHDALRLAKERGEHLLLDALDTDLEVDA